MIRQSGRPRGLFALILCTLLVTGWGSPAGAAGMQSTGVQAAGAPDPVRVFVEGGQIRSDVPPVLREGRVFVPLRAVFTALGATVEWQSASRTVVAQREAMVLRLAVGSDVAELNGAPRRLDAPAFIDQGRTMIPLRFAAEALGATVHWAPATRSVWIWTAPPDLAPDGAEFRELLTGVRWIAYSPTHFNPEVGSFPLLQDIRADLATLREAGFDGLVTHDSAGVLGKIPGLARELGFRAVIAGVWLPTDITGRPTSSAWQAIENALAARDDVIGYAVGHQGLGQRYSRALLEEVMGLLRAAGRRVATAEELSRYADDELAGLGDWLFPVVHPWHYGLREPDRAAVWVAEQVQRLEARFPGRPLLAAETGFPGEGGSGASEQAQAEFFLALRGQLVPAVWFEAFDQTWKPGPVEPHWGIFTAQRQPKAAARVLLAPEPPELAPAVPEPGAEADAAARPQYILEGLNFGPYLGDQDPNRGATVSRAQLEARMRIVAPYTRRVRTFGAGSGLEYAGEIAHSLDLQIAMGAWLGRDAAANEREVASLIAAVRAGQVDIVVVGSEALLRGDLTEAQLLDYIGRVRQAAGGVPVTTAEPYSLLLSHPTLLAAVDVVFVNFYPYWEGVAVDQAVAVLHSQYRRMVEAAGGKEVVVAETGWPSDGDLVGQAIPSPENAAFYFQNFVSWARANEVPYYYFEALDEPWKAAYEGPQGAHWGVWDQSGALKPGMERVFAGKVLPDTWTGGDLVGGPGQPAIEFTSVPPYGSTEALHGRVLHVRPQDYRVAVYIYVNGGWWTKPYWDTPVVDIRPDGTWSARVVTGGVDHQATRIAAFLLSAGYSPPLGKGQAALPAELAEAAVAQVEVSRSP